MNKNKKFLESQISDAHYIDVLFKNFRNYLQNIFKTTRRSSEFSLPAMKAERKGFGRAGGVNEGYLLTRDMTVVKLLLAKVRIFLYSSTNTGKLKISTENSEHT